MQAAPSRCAMGNSISNRRSVATKSKAVLGPGLQVGRNTFVTRSKVRTSFIGESGKWATRPRSPCFARQGLVRKAADDCMSVCCDFLSFAHCDDPDWNLSDSFSGLFCASLNCAQTTPPQPQEGSLLSLPCCSAVASLARSQRRSESDSESESESASQTSCSVSVTQFDFNSPQFTPSYNCQEFHRLPVHEFADWFAQTAWIVNAHLSDEAHFSGFLCNNLQLFSKGDLRNLQRLVALTHSLVRLAIASAAKARLSFCAAFNHSYLVSAVFLLFTSICAPLTALTL